MQVPLAGRQFQVFRYEPKRCPFICRCRGNLLPAHADNGIYQIDVSPGKNPAGYTFNGATPGKTIFFCETQPKVYIGYGLNRLFSDREPIV